MCMCQLFCSLTTILSIFSLQLVVNTVYAERHLFIMLILGFGGATRPLKNKKLEKHFKINQLIQFQYSLTCECHLQPMVKTKYYVLALLTTSVATLGTQPNKFDRLDAAQWSALGSYNPTSCHLRLLQLVPASSPKKL